MKSITFSELEQIRTAIRKAILEKKDVVWLRKEIKKIGVGFPNFWFSPGFKMITFDNSILVDPDGIKEKKKLFAYEN